MKTCPKCLKSEPDVTFGIARSRYDGKTPYCRGCWTLYVQQKRWAKGTKPVTPFLERLWEGVQVCEHGIDCPYCCWPWLKARDEDGYGKFATTNATKRHLMHPVTRIVYEIWHARLIPNGLLVLHYCDSPPCCNPTHLWLGTLVQNRADCVQKGRQAKRLTSGHATHPEAFPKGLAHSRAKLEAHEVRKIRELFAVGFTSPQLAVRYNVSKFCILCVVHYKTYKDVE